MWINSGVTSEIIVLWGLKGRLEMPEQTPSAMKKTLIISDLGGFSDKYEQLDECRNLSPETVHKFVEGLLTNRYRAHHS